MFSFALSLLQICISKVGQYSDNHQHHLLNSTRSIPTLPSPLIKIKPRQLLSRILNILLRFHSHVENRTILTATDNLTVHASLTPLTLRPQSPEPHFQLTDLRQRLRIQFSDARTAVFAHGACFLGGGDERLFATHAGLGLFGEFH